MKRNFFIGFFLLAVLAWVINAQPNSGPFPVGGGSGTNVIGYIGTVPSYTSNAVPDYTRFYVTGSTLDKINGTYLLAWTNGVITNVNTQAVWTNTTSTNFIYQNDNALGAMGVIEGITNDVDGYFYVSVSDIPPNNQNHWQPANSASVDDTLTVRPGTNYVLASEKNILGFSNTFFDTITGANSNVVWVNPAIGNDTNAYSLFGYPFYTISNACLSPLIRGGGVMNLAPGIYTETNFMFIPKNVVVNADGAVLIGPGGENGVSIGNTQFNISSGDTINGLRMTNGSIYTPVLQNGPYPDGYATGITLNHCYCHSGIDGLIFWTIDGLDDFDGNYGSGWDGVYVGGSHTNAVMRFHRPYIQCIAPPFGDQNTTGQHGIVLFNYLGKMEIWGGTIICLGATNKLAAQPNACIAIMNSASTMSIVLHGTTFIYGSTNAGVVVTPIGYASGQSAVNISGDYYDQTNITGNLYETNMTVKHVYINSGARSGAISATGFTNSLLVPVIANISGSSVSWTNFFADGTSWATNVSLSPVDTQVYMNSGDYFRAPSGLSGRWMNVIQ